MSEPTGRGMKTYAVVFRVGDNAPWRIDAPELPGCHSQARTILSGLDHIHPARALAGAQAWLAQLGTAELLGLLRRAGRAPARDPSSS